MKSEEEKKNSSNIEVKKKVENISDDNVSKPSDKSTEYKPTSDQVAFGLEGLLDLIPKEELRSIPIDLKNKHHGPSIDTLHFDLSKTL